MHSPCLITSSFRGLALPVRAAAALSYRPLVPFIPLDSARVTPEQVRKWSRRTPAERLAGAHYSRAKRLNGGKPNGWWSARQWEALVASAGSRCFWCSAHTNRPSPDHLLPLSRGGVDAIANIRVSCPTCQCRRSNRTLAEYFDWLAEHEHEEAA